MMRRLWIALCVALLLMAGGPAWSIGYVQKSNTGGTYWGRSMSSSELVYPSCVSACQSMAQSTSSNGSTFSKSNHICGPLADIGNQYVVGWGFVQGYQSICTFHYVNRNSEGQVTGSGESSVGVMGAGLAAACPAGAIPQSDGSCKCEPAVRPSTDGKSCVPYQCVKNGLTFANDGYGPLSQADIMKPRLTCVGPGTNEYGCTLEFTPQSGKCTDPLHCWNQGSSATNGEYCDGTPSQPKTPLPDEPTLPPPQPACPSSTGLCPGEVNGQTVCLPCSSTTAPPKTSTETGPDGTKDTKTETKCDGANCTTTTTTTTTPNGNGAVTVTVKVDNEPQPDFCEGHPNSPMCAEGEDSTFGGSCAGGFQCEGDAIQCAIAREQHSRFCEMATHTDVTASGEAMIDNNPRPQGHPGNEAETQEVSFAGAIDSSNPLGAGSCPGDQTFSVMGRPVAIPWSKTCDALIAIGNIGVALSMLVAAFIAFKQ